MADLHSVFRTMAIERFPGKALRRITREAAQAIYGERIVGALRELAAEDGKLKRLLAEARPGDTTLKNLCRETGGLRRVGQPRAMLWIAFTTPVGLALREERGRDLLWRPAYGYDGQGATRLAHIPAGATAETGRSIQRDSGGPRNNRNTP